MSLTLVCDRCGEPIDLTEGYYQVHVQLVVPPSSGPGGPQAPLPSALGPAPREGSQVHLACGDGLSNLAARG